MLASLAAAGMAACGGDGGNGASDTFKGTSLENEPVLLDTGEYTQALVEKLRDCGVEGDIGDYVSQNRLADTQVGAYFDAGARTIEITQYEKGQVSSSVKLTLRTYTDDDFDLYYKIACERL